MNALSKLVIRLKQDAAVLLFSEIITLKNLGWVKRNKNGHLYVTKAGKLALQLSQEEV